ncbi:MAG: hypothetical protein GF307_10235 [candidate division Zixibacteria bacterium]|nr:hypothetical protein [candidate division Zixibacteria bacterium]
MGSLKLKSFIIGPCLAMALLITACGGTAGQQSAMPGGRQSGVQFVYLETIGPEIIGTSKLSNPVDIAFDVGGSLFICDNGNNRIVKLTSKGVFVREIGGFAGNEEQLSSPVSVGFENGLTLMVVDSQLRMIKRFDRDLNFIDMFSRYKDDQGSEISIGKPMGIHAGRAGDIYISESDNDRILLLDNFYNLRAEIGGFGFGQGEVRNPYRMTTGKNDRLFVADTDNGRVAVYNSLGEYESEIGSGILRRPVDVAIGKNGIIFVSDAGLESIVAFSRNGDYLGDSAVNNLIFGEPAGIEFDSQGRLFAVDKGRGQVMVLKIAG